VTNISNSAAALGSYAGDRAWADDRPSVLQNDWLALHARWTQRVLRRPLQQVVLLVVNHGRNHRGGVSGFLRAMGRATEARLSV